MMIQSKLIVETRDDPGEEGVKKVNSVQNKQEVITPPSQTN